MKKFKFNSTLEHKSPGYAPYQIEVEKIITLYGREFEKMRDCPINDNPYITEHSDLMYMDGDTAHCLLFLDANGSDGILVEAKGFGYARKSQFIPNARAIIEANDITAGERQLHAELRGMADRIAELAHAGQKHFTFEEMLGDGDMKAMMIQAVAEMLDRRDDLAEVRDHYLGISGQHDFTVIAKPTQEMKLYCPLVIQAEPQIYETDWDEEYGEELMKIYLQPQEQTEDELSVQTETADGTQTTETTAETLMETNCETSTTEPAPFVTSETLPAEVMQELTSQAEELNNAYPDAIGWLYILGTNINYPIMQSADNDFYLHHAPDGRSLKAGSVFLDFRCENRFMNGVNIVYAHNMNNGTMFAGITRFTDSAYFSSHRYGWLSTSETVFRIDFFSAAVVGRYDVLYDGSAEISSWLSHLAEVSKIYENANISVDTRFISLSTCSYEFKDARTVLTGTLTEMGGV